MMKQLKEITCLFGLLLGSFASVSAGEISLKITKKYLNLPVSQQQDRARMKLEVNGKSEREFVIRLASETPDYWVFYDMTSFKGKTVRISYDGNEAGLSKIYQDDVIYDMNFNRINGTFYSPEDMTSMELSADIIIDKTSVEVFIDNGAYSYSMQRDPEKRNQEGLHFWGRNIEVKSSEVCTMKSIWR